MTSKRQQIMPMVLYVFAMLN